MVRNVAEQLFLYNEHCSEWQGSWNALTTLGMEGRSKVKRSSITKVVIISSATDSARVERETLHEMRRASGGRVIREAERFIYTGGETRRERKYEASGDRGRAHASDIVDVRVPASSLIWPSPGPINRRRGCNTAACLAATTCRDAGGGVVAAREQGA